MIFKKNSSLTRFFFMTLSAISVNQVFSTVAYALQCSCTIAVQKSGSRGVQEYSLNFSSPKLASCSKLNGTTIEMPEGTGTVKSCSKK